jgi:phospholipase/carboxylesterase
MLMRHCIAASMTALALTIACLSPVSAAQLPTSQMQPGCHQPGCASDFVHVVHRPENADGRTLVLLHGSGGDENSLMALAAKAAPSSLLIGVRGRVVQDGRQRWYRRLSPVRFDQDDIRREADAFADFLPRLMDEYDLDPARTVFLGYSNGANLLGALSMLHPGLVGSAILLRPMPVLDEAPSAELSRCRYLLVAGTQDKLYAPFAPDLEQMLRGAGAAVEAHMIARDHMLAEDDIRLVADWLAGVSGKMAGEPLGTSTEVLQVRN